MMAGLLGTLSGYQEVCDIIYSLEFIALCDFGKHILMKYDKTTRRIHAGLAVFIIAQLLLSLVMKVPKPGRVITLLGSESFQLHRLIGNVVLLLLFVHWGWTLSGHLPDGLGRLYPWSSKVRMKKI